MLEATIFILFVLMLWWGIQIVRHALDHDRFEFWSWWGTGIILLILILTLIKKATPQ